MFTMTKTRAKNKVQELARNRGLKTVGEFERAMTERGVARTTARHWYEYGVKGSTSVSAVQELVDFFGVSIDSLRDD